MIALFLGFLLVSTLAGDHDSYYSYNDHRYGHDNDYYGSKYYDYDNSYGFTYYDGYGSKYYDHDDDYGSKYNDSDNSYGSNYYDGLERNNSNSVSAEDWLLL